MPYIPTGSDSYGAVSAAARDLISEDLRRKVYDSDVPRSSNLPQAADGMDSSGKSTTASPLKPLIALGIFLLLVVLIFTLWLR